MGRPYACPYCHQSGQSVSKGVRKTKTLGDRRIRLCKGCGRKFTPKNQKAAADENVAAEPSQGGGAVVPAISLPVGEGGPHAISGENPAAPVPESRSNEPAS
jgi:hypothetical protein